MQALPQYREYGSTEHEVFADLALRLSTLFRNEGVPVVPFNNPELIYFRSLGVEAKKQVVQNLKFYLELCEEQVRESYSLRDSKILLWKMIKKMKYIPCSSVLDYVREGRVVEIYDMNNIQLFRNVEFMNICSYTIEDVYCRPFPELYHRDIFTVNQIAREIGKLITGKEKNTFKPRIPIHSLIEKESAFQHHIDMEANALSPLKDEHGNFAAFITITSCVITRSISPQEYELQSRDLHT